MHKPLSAHTSVNVLYPSLAIERFVKITTGSEMFRFQRDMNNLVLMVKKKSRIPSFLRGGHAYEKERGGGSLICTSTGIWKQDDNDVFLYCFEKGS